LRLLPVSLLSTRYSFNSLMPPKKQKGKRTVARSAPKTSAVRISKFVGNRLDEQARAYALLLSDPCGGALVHPTFTGGAGGLLVRAESMFTQGSLPTSTSSFVGWTPGAIGSTTYLGVNYGVSILLGESATSTTPVTITNGSNVSQPGYVYLAAAAADVRAVAACIQVFYPGAEMNRAGIVAYGTLSGAAVINGNITTVSSISNVLERYERTPTGSIEMMWRPSDYDQTPTAPTLQTPQPDINKRSGIGVTSIGGPLATGLVYRLVCVYEYTPALGSGITTASTSRSTSTSTLNMVLNALDGAGDWMVRGSALASRMYGAYNAAKSVRAVAYAGRSSQPFRLM
jgi:hypothetical protein